MADGTPARDGKRDAARDSAVYRRVAGHQLRGWYPARWAHAEMLLDRLEYHEGPATRRKPGKSLFEHVWLMFDGSVLDLTLDSREHLYLASYTVPRTEVVETMIRVNAHTFVRPVQVRTLREKTEGTR